MKYSAADVSRMRNDLKNKKSLLREAEARKDKKAVAGLKAEIRGLENSISGKYN